MAMPSVVVVMEGVFLIAFSSFGRTLLEAEVRGYLKVSRVSSGVCDRKINARGKMR
jgi:hypothetical protein